VFEALSVFVFAAEYISRLFCAPKNREALYSTFIYATTFFGIVDFLSTAPWFVQAALIATGTIEAGDDNARISESFEFSESFVTAFSKLDNVFRASKDILKATGLMVAVGIGVLQTVDGHEDDFAKVEWMTVIAFTVEYLIRLIGVGADPKFAPGRNAITSRCCFIFSFYSMVDLLAIAPFYLTVVLPGSIVDEYDEYLRMCRIIRLVKLDKYIPSITLIDDVIRLKYSTLRVAFFAAMTLWIIFAAMLYLFENEDTSNFLDDAVPAYGCVSLLMNVRR
jgi:hypothetical protein